MGEEIFMMAMAYPLSVDELITCRDCDHSVFNDGTLMLYPSQSGDGIATIEQHTPYGQTTTTIVEDDGVWRIFTFSTQKVFGKVMVREQEYISRGGHNPVWLLQAHYINGEAQPIIYNM